MIKNSKKVVFETFRELGSYDIGNLTRREPSAFNGIVNVKKYRVTIEQVDEPDEVIRQRIQELWDNCNNHHDWTPLRNMAEKYGMTLDHSTIKRKAQSKERAGWGLVNMSELKKCDLCHMTQSVGSLHECSVDDLWRRIHALEKDVEHGKDISKILAERLEKEFRKHGPFTDIPMDDAIKKWLGFANDILIYGKPNPFEHEI